MRADYLQALAPRLHRHRDKSVAPAPRPRFPFGGFDFFDVSVDKELKIFSWTDHSKKLFYLNTRKVGAKADNSGRWHF